MTNTGEVNLLLEGMRKKDKAILIQQGKLVDMSFDTMLCEVDHALKFVYFPLHGFISLVAKVDGYPAVETGLIGNEGMLGATLALGVNTSPLRGVVQGEGRALRISASRFRRVLRDCPSMQRTIHRYVCVLISQLSRGMPCIHFHEVEPRLTRWLLMSHDRSHGDVFYLTHSYLADMLGVRRSAVTIAAGSLQKRNLIQYSRGKITVLNRKGLEAASCECYDELVSDYIRMFPSG